MQSSELPGDPPERAATIGSLPHATLLAEWPNVRIGDVQSHRSSEDPFAVVRACIHLGALLPVDARVELLCDEESIGAREAPRSSRHRLWSVHSFDNGTFLFEGHVPGPALEGPHGYAIRVTSTASLANASEVPPVVRWITPQRVDREMRAEHTLCRPHSGGRLRGLLPRERP